MHSAGLLWAASSPSGVISFITTWRNVRTHRSPRGAENWKDECWNLKGWELVAVVWGEINYFREKKKNTTTDSGLPYPLPRLSHSLVCQVLTRASSKSLLYPITCTPIQIISPSRLYTITFLLYLFLLCFIINTQINLCSFLIYFASIDLNVHPFIDNQSSTDPEVFVE